MLFAKSDRFEDDPIAPWNWRKEDKKSLPKSRSHESFTCGVKSYCREMNSCEEALFYLENCELVRIDGDRDGKPCEKLCQ